MSVSKLYFRYGAMSSSKTANLLMVAYNYDIQNKKVILIKIALDNRFGDNNLVVSRCGLKRGADLVINADTKIFDKMIWSNIDCVLVDEANFLTIDQVNELRLISMFTPVICYGLRTDYKTNLFPGSKRLFELADVIEEIKTTCVFCNKKATMNFKHLNGNIIKEGSDQIDVGAEEKYLSCCWKCYNKREV